MGKPCPKHTAEFKRRAVQPYNERGTAYAEVARENSRACLSAPITLW